jgi:CRP-like cAMP-binding protein
MLRTFRRQPPDRLKSIDQFRFCTNAQLRKVARLAEHVKIDQGKVVVTERQTDRELFLILTGTVEVTQAGRRVNALGPCDFFGELGALNRGTRSATVTALSDLELLVIGPREFDSLAQIPGFRNALLKRMANRLRIVDARLTAAGGEEAFSGQDAPQQDGASTSFPGVTRHIASEAR